MKKQNKKIGLHILLFLFIIFFTHSCFIPKCYCYKERGCYTIAAVRRDNKEVIATKTFCFSNEFDKNDSISLFKQSFPQDGSIRFWEDYDSLEYYDGIGEVSEQEATEYHKLKYSCGCEK
ncbi:hypothetical protein FACS189413_14710 [Bacteroidia bacterium]|nr:hypothetical protein FACS189413_14710 [Bacteroidia bacterium]